MPRHLAERKVPDGGDQRDRQHSGRRCVCVCDASHTRSDRFLTGRAPGCQTLNLRLLKGNFITVGGSQETPAPARPQSRSSCKALILLSTPLHPGFYPRRGWEERSLLRGHPYIPQPFNRTECALCSRWEEPCPPHSLTTWAVTLLSTLFVGGGAPLGHTLDVVTGKP